MYLFQLFIFIYSFENLCITPFYAWYTDCSHFGTRKQLGYHFLIFLLVQIVISQRKRVRIIFNSLE